MNEHPLGRRADLAAIRMTRGQDRRHRDLQVRVLPNDGRRLAAELERHTREIRRGARHDGLAGIAVPRERHERRQRIVDERLAGVAGARYEIDDAGREIDMLVEQPNTRLDDPGVGEIARSCDDDGD